MPAFVIASITLIKCKVVRMAQFTLIQKGLHTGAHIFCDGTVYIFKRLSNM